MSSAPLAVRFPDGEIRWGIYSGTVDIALPWLFATDDEAWDQNQKQMRTWDEKPIGEVFEVDVFSYYGYGFWWRGRATKDLYLGPYGDPNGLDPEHTIVELGSFNNVEMTDPADAPEWIRELVHR